MKKKLLIGLASLVGLGIIIGIIVMATAAAEFEVSNLSISPEEAKPGETITVTVEVRNTGEEKGTHELELIIEGVVEQSNSVTLAGGETSSVSFSVEKDVQGSYSVELDGLTGVFEVVEPEPTPTPVRGVLSGDVVWTAGESPYILTGNVLVPEGSKLTIEPGVHVILSERFIQVEGALQLLGTSGQPVKITGQVNIGHPRIIFKANSVSWDEDTQSGSVIRNAIIEGQSYGYGLILIEDSSPKITNSTLTNTNPSGAVISMPFGGSPQIISNRIFGEFGILFAGSGFPQIVDNRIEGHDGAMGINLALTRGTESHVEIEGNLITGFEYGVVIQSLDDNHHVNIISNHITNNQIGIHTGNYDLTGQPSLIIKMNAIHSNHWNAQSGNFDVDMTENWWGSVDGATIQGRLYDYYQDFNRGHIIYEPFLIELPSDVPLP